MRGEEGMRVVRSQHVLAAGCAKNPLIHIAGSNSALRRAPPEPPPSRAGSESGAGLDMICCASSSVMAFFPSHTARCSGQCYCAPQRSPTAVVMSEHTYLAKVFDRTIRRSVFARRAGERGRVPAYDARGRDDRFQRSQWMRLRPFALMWCGGNRWQDRVYSHSVHSRRCGLGNELCPLPLITCRVARQVRLLYPVTTVTVT